MAISTEPVFEYHGKEVVEFQSALKLIADRLSQLSLTEIRKIICRSTGGSYADFARFLRPDECSTLRLKTADVLLFRDIANAMANHLSERDVRLIQTWSKAVMADYRESINLTGGDFGFEQSRALA